MLNRLAIQCSCLSILFSTTFVNLLGIRTSCLTLLSNTTSISTLCIAFVHQGISVHSPLGNLPWFLFNYIQVDQPICLVIDFVFKVGYFILAFQLIHRKSIQSLTSLQALDSFLLWPGKRLPSQWYCAHLFLCKWHWYWLWISSMVCFLDLLFPVLSEIILDIRGRGLQLQSWK